MARVVRLRAERIPKEAKAPWRCRPENFIKLLLSSAKSRAKETGRYFTITAADIGEIPECCPVLGIELHFYRGSGEGQHDDSPSLDRIDSTKGYIPGNVWIISWLANRTKGSKAVWELEDAERWLNAVPGGRRLPFAVSPESIF